MAVQSINNLKEKRKRKKKIYLTMYIHTIH